MPSKKNKKKSYSIPKVKIKSIKKPAFKRFFVTAKVKGKTKILGAFSTKASAKAKVSRLRKTKLVK